MTALTLWAIRPLVAAICAGLPICALPLPRGEIRPDSYWDVDSIRAGMKGHGRTVMRGTKVELFDVEILGVLKNTSPGRDLVLGRLSGLNLDKTGVIAGMSGSPVYVDGKLLGAVAYAWSFGKEPIAGITPFCQMHNYVVAYERRERDAGQPSRIGLRTPILIDGRPIDHVTISDVPDSSPTAGHGLWMTPLRTPLVASGFTAHSLALLRERSAGAGWFPVQSGGAAGDIGAREKDIVLEPGGPLAVALIRGDFDLSGIGTVTHIDAKRVYGWGHPFLNIGSCDFPLMTGYIHAVYPRQTVSFKIGSPLKSVGAITADVSTGIAGWLDRTPELLPVAMTVCRGPSGATKTFHIEVVRQRSLLSTLVYTALTNSVDMEGDLPEDLTAELVARIEIEGREPVTIQDTYSGPSFSGGRAPQALYHHIAGLIHLLAYNPFEAVRLTRIECETLIQPGRRTAEIEAVELHSEVLSPGESLRATAFIKPYKSLRQRVPISLTLPTDLPEGVYTATVCDDPTAVRAQVRDNPLLNNPQNLEQVFEAIEAQTATRRTHLALRVSIPAAGVAIDAHALPNLPPSMVQILGASRRTGAQALSTALVARMPTDWVLQGSESVRFVVAKNKKLSHAD
jgi:hypothetical protein